MTGYGTATRDAPGARIVVEIRGVNQRHLDVRISGAREYLPWERDIRERVRAVVERGRVDVQITRQPKSERRRYRVALREDLAQAYLRAARRLQRRTGVGGEIRMSELLQLPELLEVEEQPPDPRRELPVLYRTLAGALAAFDAQRRREGRHLAADMRRRVGVLAGVARGLRRRLPAAHRVIRKRLIERLTRLTEGLEVDASRLAYEAAVLIERADVTEEIVRLDGHVGAMRLALGERGPIGKRIEFLLQEAQRELNTTGAKAAAPELSTLVLQGKEAVEKLREQVQNVE